MLATSVSYLFCKHVRFVKKKHVEDIVYHESNKKHVYQEENAMLNNTWDGDGAKYVLDNINALLLAVTNWC